MDDHDIIACRNIFETLYGKIRKGGERPGSGIAKLFREKSGKLPPKDILAELSALSDRCGEEKRHKRGSLQSRLNVAAYDRHPLKILCNQITQGNRPRDAPIVMLWLWVKDGARLRTALASAGSPLPDSIPPPRDEWLTPLPREAHVISSSGRVSFTHIQSESPYDVDKIFDLAKSRLVLIAQNHFRMTNGDEDTQQRIFDSVKAALKRRVKIRIIAMHPEVRRKKEDGSYVAPDAVAVWSEYHKSSEFRKQLNKTWETLGGWVKAVNDEGIAPRGRLEVWGAYLVPVSLTLIDREEDEGGAVIVSPRTQNQNSGHRLHIVIRKGEDGFPYFANEIDNFHVEVGAKLWPFN